MTSLVSCCARIVNKNKWPTLLHDRADVTVEYCYSLNLCQTTKQTLSTCMYRYEDNRNPVLTIIHYQIHILMKLIRYPPFFQNFHINHSFFKMFIIIRFSSFDNISWRHTSWIIRVFCVHSFSLIQYKREGKQLHFHISRHIAHLGWETEKQLRF
jgi:hypothetical protein